MFEYFEGAWEYVEFGNMYPRTNPIANLSPTPQTLKPQNQNIQHRNSSPTPTTLLRQIDSPGRGGSEMITRDVRPQSERKSEHYTLAHTDSHTHVLAIQTLTTQTHCTRNTNSQHKLTTHTFQVVSALGVGNFVKCVSFGECFFR